MGKIAFLFLVGLILVFGFGCSSLTDVESAQDQSVPASYIVEGTAELVSDMPEPAKSDYPNCNFTCVLKVKQIVSGAVLPAEIVLVVPGFRDRADLGHQIGKGDRLRAAITPLEAMPEEFQQIQLADENENFELPYFAVSNFEKLKRFAVGDYPLPREKNVVRWWETPLNPPLSDLSRKVRAEQMQKALRDNEERLAELEKRLPQYEKAISGFAKNHRGFVHAWKNDGFFGLNADAVSIGNPWVRQQDKYSVCTTISQLTALDRFLTFHHIDLVVCILPSPDEVAIGEFIPEAAGYRNLRNLQFIRELLLSGIDAVDLYDFTMAHRYDYPLVFQYHRNNAHPHTGMCAISGRFLAEYLAPRKYLARYAMEGEIVPCRDNQHTNVWSVENSRFPVKSPAPLSKVEWQHRDKNAAKEILIAGNSYSTYPVSGGTVGDFLAYYSHAPYDWIGGESGASSIPRRLLNSGDRVLPGKKVMILFVGVGHLLAPDFQDIELLSQCARIYSLPWERMLTAQRHSSYCEVYVAIPEKVAPEQILAVKLRLNAKLRAPWAFAEIPGCARQNFRPEPKGGTVVLKLTEPLRGNGFTVRFYYPEEQTFSGTLTQVDFYLGDKRQ